MILAIISVVIGIIGLTMSIVMAVLSKPPEISKSKLGDFSFPKANFGDPVPMVWGTVKQASPVIAWYGDYKTEAIKKKKVGKNPTIGYKNIISIHMLLCLGPEVKFRKMWAGTYLFADMTVSPFTDTNFNVWADTLYGGNGVGSQGGLEGTMTVSSGAAIAAYPPLSLSATPYPKYNGIAFAFWKGYIGNSTQPKPFAFEIMRLSKKLSQQYSVMPNGLDLNPMEVAYDILTSADGGFGNDPSVLDLSSFTSAAHTLFTENVGMSIVLKRSISGKDILDEVSKIADCIFYQDSQTSKIKVRLIRQDYDVNTLPVFDESIISSLDSFEKTTWENTINQCRVTYSDRSNDYNDAIAVAQDFANINSQGKVVSQEVSVLGCTNGELANKLANRYLSAAAVPLYKANLKVNRQAASLNPGDLFVLNWAPLGIENIVMRAMEIDYGTLESNEVTLSCIQDKFAVNQATFANPESSLFEPVDIQANIVSDFLIANAPAFLINAANLQDGGNRSNSYYNAMIVAGAPSDISVGYDVIDSNSTSFPSEPRYVFEDHPYDAVGKLQTIIDKSTANADRKITTGITVSDLSEFEVASFVQTSQLDNVRDGSTLFAIGNELFAYVGFTDNSDGTVTFNTVYRSLLDTAAEAHNQNDGVYFFDVSNLLDVPFYGSQNHYFKLLDNTPITQLAASSAPAESLQFTNRAMNALPPAYVTVAGQREPVAVTFDSNGKITVAWRNRDSKDSTLRVYNDTTDTREVGTVTLISWYKDDVHIPSYDVSTNTNSADFSPVAGDGYKIKIKSSYAGANYSYEETIGPFSVGSHF
ncbi:MAG: phage tail protein [Tetrasphaera sp.]|nr:phage tail protein [Tetrasphaera sp.]